MRTLLALALLATCSAAGAQANSLAVGSILLTIGSDKASVLASLKARYFIVNVTGDADTAFISDGKPPNVRVIGGVAFRDGRLTWIQRSWGTFSGKVNPVQVSKALFAALESAAQATGASATTSTSVRQAPGVEFKTVEFDFPGRKVVLATTDGEAQMGGQQVNIDETIRTPPLGSVTAPLK